MINLDGRTLTSSEVRLVARGEKVSVAVDAWLNVDKSRAVVEDIIEQDETVYGINTGFGALANQTISKDDLSLLQINLIR